MRALLAVLPLLVACSSAPEKETPIPAGSYLLTNGNESAQMIIDDEGGFAWKVRTCGDWLRDGSGSLERDVDGSIRVISCDSAVGAQGGARWMPNVDARRLRARVTETGFELDVTPVEGQGSLFTQIWERSDRCTSSCDCDPPTRRSC